MEGCPIDWQVPSPGSQYPKTMTAPQFHPGFLRCRGVWHFDDRAKYGINRSFWPWTRPQVHYRGCYYHVMSFPVRRKAERSVKFLDARVSRREIPNVGNKKMAVDGKWRVIPGRPVFLGCKKPDLARYLGNLTSFTLRMLYSFLGSCTDFVTNVLFFSFLNALARFFRWKRISRVIVIENILLWGACKKEHAISQSKLKLL